MGLFDYPDTTPAVESLSEITFLAELSSEDWTKVQKIVKTRLFRAGDDLIRAGDKDDSFYILTRGEVEVVIGERVLATIAEGSVFGEISFFDGALRSANIRAKVSGSALRVTREDMDNLGAWEPEIARKMLFDLGRVLAMRLRWTTKRTSSS